MFEDATFYSRSAQSTQTSRWMLLTLTCNLAAVAALIVYPLIYPEGLPARLLQRVLYAPPPALAVELQPHMSQHLPAQTTTLLNPFAAPRVIPPTLRTDPSAALPTPAFLDLSTTSGGIVGADGPAISLFHTAPRPAVRPAPPRSIPVSSGVIEGYILQRTAPTYPAIARTIGVSGTVALAATISKSGAIENLRILSGHPMLCQAAIDAVQKWRYRPYLLNGQPVEVETTINVVFTLGNR